MLSIVKTPSLSPTQESVPLFEPNTSSLTNLTSVAAFVMSNLKLISLEYAEPFISAVAFAFTLTVNSPLCKS